MVACCTVTAKPAESGVLPPAWLALSVVVLPADAVPPTVAPVVEPVVPAGVFPGVAVEPVEPVVAPVPAVVPPAAGAASPLAAACFVWEGEGVSG